MRRYSVLILWGVASLYGLWRGVRLAFFRVATQATVVPGGQPEVVEPAFFPGGIIVLVVAIVLYAMLGHLAYTRQYGLFRLVAGVHIALSLLSLPSVGWLFLPSSGLLLLAIIFSFVLPDRRINRLVRHHDA